MFAVLLVGLSVGGFVLSCQYAANLAYVSPSFGITVPRYLLGAIDPTFYFLIQVGTMFMVFDSSHRLRRERVEETLLSRPVSNLKFLVAQTIGTTSLIWVLVTVILACLYLFGVSAASVGLTHIKPFQFHSLFNLIVIDLYILVLFSSSFTILLCALFKSRIVVVLTTLLSFLLTYLLVANSSYALLAVTSPFSNDSLLLSELLPSLPKITTFGIRIATLVSTSALVVAAVLFWSRRDPYASTMRVVSTSLLAIIGVGIWCWSFVHNSSWNNQTDIWRETHLQAEKTQKIDITSITGNVDIDPGVQLKINLTLNMKMLELSENRLVLSLNPGLKVQQIVMNDIKRPFTFENGLLVVEIPNTDYKDHPVAIKVVAQGRPDSRFAYLDSVLDLTRSLTVPKSALRLFGTDGSIFDSQFIALMPGSAWYPLPFTMASSANLRSYPDDFFDFDIAVNLTRENWQLAGTGTTERTRQSKTSYRFYSNMPVSELGLFAAEFQSTSVEVAGVRIKILLHPRNRDLQELSTEFRPTLKAFVEQFIRDFSRTKLTLPSNQITLVEVPSRLRTIGGGWRMDSEAMLPGVILVKEYGIPSLNEESLWSKVSDLVTSKDKQVVSFLKQYIQNGLGLDNISIDIPDLLWSQVTSASGLYAAEIAHIFRNLISSLGEVPYESFNVYSVIHVAPLTQINRNNFRLNSGFSSFLVHDSDHRRTLFHPKYLEVNYGSRQAVWDLAERYRLVDDPATLGHKSELELFLFKTNEIAKGILEMNSEQSVFAWLAAIRKQSWGGTYTYDEVLSLATEHEVIVEPFLTEWISETGLPGFLATFAEVSQIKPNSQGIQLFETKIDIHNPTSVSGLITPRYRKALTTRLGWNESAFIDSAPIVLQASESKRISLVEEYPIRAVIVEPHLSLNRTNIYLINYYLEIDERTDLNAGPYVQSSRWVPVENAVVIDDLDAGFSVYQPRTVVGFDHWTQSGPMKWFFGFRHPLEQDAGLPTLEFLETQRVAKDQWQRTSTVGAYGRYRQTYLSVESFTPSHKASITAELPAEGDWQLEYYLPYDWSVFFDGEPSQMLLEVISEEINSEQVISLDKLTRKWNHIGSYTLEKGKVAVEITGTTTNGPIVVDALRWSLN